MRRGNPPSTQIPAPAMAADSLKVRKAQALQFLLAFPEVKAFKILLLTPEKGTIRNEEKMARHDLMQNWTHGLQ